MNRFLRTPSPSPSSSAGPDNQPVARNAIPPLMQSPRRFSTYKNPAERSSATASRGSSAPSNVTPHRFHAHQPAPERSNSSVSLAGATSTTMSSRQFQVQQARPQVPVPLMHCLPSSSNASSVRFGQMTMQYPMGFPALTTMHRVFPTLAGQLPNIVLRVHLVMLNSISVDISCPRCTVVPNAVIQAMEELGVTVRYGSYRIVVDDGDVSYPPFLLEKTQISEGMKLTVIAEHPTPYSTSVLPSLVQQEALLVLPTPSVAASVSASRIKVSSVTAGAGPSDGSRKRKPDSGEAGPGAKRAPQNGPSSTPRSFFIDIFNLIFPKWKMCSYIDTTIGIPQTERTNSVRKSWRFKFAFSDHVPVIIREFSAEQGKPRTCQPILIFRDGQISPKNKWRVETEYWVFKDWVHAVYNHRMSYSDERGLSFQDCEVLPLGDGSSAWTEATYEVARKH